MTRGTAALGRRSHWPVTLAAGVLLGGVPGGLAYMALRPAPEAEPPPLDPAPVIVNSLAASTSIAAPAPAPEPTSEAKAPPAAIQPRDRAPSRPVDMPYRFVGKSASGGKSSIVLFGRGRVVTLQGPAPLDDEYVVEAVFDDYLVLRHIPSGVGKFLPLVRRQQVLESPRDPEDSPHD